MNDRKKNYLDVMKEKKEDPNLDKFDKDWAKVAYIFIVKVSVAVTIMWTIYWLDQKAGSIIKYLLLFF